MAGPGLGMAVWGSQGPFSYDAKRMQKTMNRRTVDFNSSVVRYLQDRVWQRDYRDQPAVQPHHAYFEEKFPPLHAKHNPLNAVTTKFVRSATNKFRCPIFALQWTPEGRRLVTGASSGEFTLWNGLTFNFETILQAHDVAIRSIMWSHNDLWLVSCDTAGFVKYWQSNMNTVKMFQAHKEPIRDSSFSPNDSKLITCSDDSTVRVWDFSHCHEERVLRGHGSDVKSCDWHPTKGLVVSGSRDSQQNLKLWDPKTGDELCTLHGHKSTVTRTKFNRNGNWLLTASRDHLLKLWDIRMMKEIKTFRGHKKDVHAVAWHPAHEDMFASGGADGSLLFWMSNMDKEIGSVETAHDSAIWSLAWHPLGHMLVSGSNDHSCKFWTRNPPGDSMTDRYNLGHGTQQASGPVPDEEEQDDMESAFIPGMGEIVKGVSIPSDLIATHKAGGQQPQLRPAAGSRKDAPPRRGGPPTGRHQRRDNNNYGGGGAATAATGANQEPVVAKLGGFLSMPAGQTASGQDMVDPLSVAPQANVLQLLKQQQELSNQQQKQHEHQKQEPGQQQQQYPGDELPPNAPPQFHRHGHQPPPSADMHNQQRPAHGKRQGQVQTFKQEPSERPPPGGPRHDGPRPDGGPARFLSNMERPSRVPPPHLAFGSGGGNQPPVSTPDAGFAPRQGPPSAEKRAWQGDCAGPYGDGVGPYGGEAPAQFPRTVGDPSDANSSAALHTSGGPPRHGPPGPPARGPGAHGPPRQPMPGQMLRGQPPPPPGPGPFAGNPHGPGAPDGAPQPPTMNDGRPPMFDGGGPPPHGGGPPPHGGPPPGWREAPPHGMPMDGTMHPGPDGPGGGPNRPPPGWFPPDGRGRGGRGQGRRKRGRGGR